MLGSKQRERDLSNQAIGRKLLHSPLIRVVFLFLIFLQVQRFLFYWNSLEKFESVSGAEIFMAHLVGLRFDLLVLGFLAIPPLLVAPFFCGKPFSSTRGWSFLSFYLSITWGLICLMGLVDLFYFSYAGLRLTQVALAANETWTVITSIVTRWGVGLVLTNVAIFLCLAFLGVREAQRIKSGGLLFTSFWKVWAVCLVLTAISARGTVTPHHLEWRHARVSENRTTQELTVNSVWAWDKDPNRTQPQ